MTVDIDIRHRLGQFQIDARFTANARALALFGRSGAGKTSLVQIIAGLISPDRGHVRIGNETLVDTARGISVPPYRRRVGYVFQDGRLFPHLTVRRNLLYGSWFADTERTGASLGQVLDMLGIGPLLDRYPAGLSGGEKQRVAIGRALLAKPRLLLMDEPLASLDEERKDEILPYLIRLKDESGVPIILVSHSIAEVSRLADNVVLMDKGRSTFVGPTAEAMQRVEMVRIAGSATSKSFIDAIVVRHDPNFDLTILRSAAGEWRVAGRAYDEGAPVRLIVEPSDVMIATGEAKGVSALNSFEGIITRISSNRGVSEVQIDCEGDLLNAQITTYSCENLELSVGMRVHALIKAVALVSRAASESDAGMSDASTGRDKAM
jgi:molybdate transport system ATP-binding protein